MLSALDVIRSNFRNSFVIPLLFVLALILKEDIRLSIVLENTHIELIEVIP